MRLQADLRLVFRVRSETYSQYRFFVKDKVKAYSTCEVVLLDGFIYWPELDMHLARAFESHFLYARE